ncbi:MAG: hypothetical protein U5N21_23585 [Rhodococcus sp. (in: high G+C Gram-positive bacteria)]|nr:hypothetical protein [Rhodococcus sp. (in: high G+C Gram-positive bacteria)]
MVLSLLAASACYEYAGFPHTALELSDVAAARQLLRLRECRQDFSVLEAPGDVAIIAFPGTHDVRTAVTDVKFSRVTERSFSHINNGLMRSGPSQPYRQMHGGVHQLWHYRVHEGFHGEEVKLRMSLTTSMVRNMIAEGKRVVFTGHSLGGALATLATVRMLEEDLPAFQGKVGCVTFGAPLVGNSALSTKVRRQGWTRHFLHIVAKSDIVPRLLTERDIHRHAAIALRAAIASRVDFVRGLFGTTTTPKSHTAAAAAGGSEAAAVAELELSMAVNAAPQAVGPLTDEDTVRARGEDDRDTIDEGFTASGTTCVLEKRAFDCFGEYHMLQRNVRYKATTNHLAAYNALRDGDGCRLDIADHLLDSYNRCVTLQIRSHVEGAASAAAAAAVAKAAGAAGAKR